MQRTVSHREKRHIFLVDAGYWMVVWISSVTVFLFVSCCMSFVLPILYLSFSFSNSFSLSFLISLFLYFSYHLLSFHPPPLHSKLFPSFFHTLPFPVNICSKMSLVCVLNRSWRTSSRSFMTSTPSVSWASSQHRIRLPRGTATSATTLNATWM